LISFQPISQSDSEVWLWCHTRWWTNYKKWDGGKECWMGREGSSL